MPSPTFPMSSCLTDVGSRACRFDLDIVTKSSSSSPRSSQSSPSSTLSESSNSTPLFISTKRARAPRKRPNQCSAEAAALLSTIYPKVFSTTNFRQPTFFLQQPPDDPFPILLPSFPITGDGSLVHRNLPSPERPPIGLVPRAAKVADIPICCPQDFQFQDPGSPDFDAESILDEEVEDGIDSIMGNLSMSTNQSKDSNGDCPCSNTNSIINPYLANLMGFGLSGRFGFGFGILSNLRGALRQSDDEEWWRSPKVSVNDIVPKFKVPVEKPAVASKKKKKKKVEETMAANVNTAVSLDQDGIFKRKLGLNLNYDGILKEWSGGPPFSGEAGSPESAADVIALLGDIDLFPDTGGGAVREACMQRYKEKRRNRLFSKKIRYQVRKVNADQRPRMKASQGRFVRTPSLVEETMAEGS